MLKWKKNLSWLWPYFLPKLPAEIIVLTFCSHKGIFNKSKVRFLLTSFSRKKMSGEKNSPFRCIFGVDWQLTLYFSWAQEFQLANSHSKITYRPKFKFLKKMQRKKWIITINKYSFFFLNELPPKSSPLL